MRIIDEVRSPNDAQDAANVLLGVLEQRPMAVTTDWGTVPNDRDLAQVILRRVREPGEHVVLEGRS